MHCIKCLYNKLNCCCINMTAKGICTIQFFSFPQWLRHVIALQCSIMKHLSAKQMSSSLRALELTDMSGVKTQECMETQEISGTQVGPQGAPLLPSLAPKHPESCRERSCQADSDSPAEKGTGVNGPVVCEGKSCMTAETPHRLQTPLSEPALPNHVDIKTESSSPLSSCVQRDTPSSTSLASGPNSSFSSQTKGF